ncbi:hypothetical protein BMR1_03g02210 [Babesia microti strain RI]|uniref:Uncharacterized protein n=1 Tax=Babesia microti (strain RI) TaxID=1133968 RepID=A0A0K3ATZ7_BABMR|nr:hypothetical protein BMR1_03g02210 [Babesia microti strain RI]CTQ41041.1 hypothetical protein BMR1_03g02210 [Babesia microti strain RI]|eukprot:XP_012649052.1 hypothetical protein BMR1_03g02210 [Babesia microti strain RI]
MVWIYKFHYDENFVNDKWLWDRKSLMISVAKYIRRIIPPWMIEYLPKWIVNWLYPPFHPLRYYSGYVRSPYLLLSVASAIISLYLLYKLYYNLYGFNQLNDTIYTTASPQFKHIYQSTAQLNTKATITIDDDDGDDNNECGSTDATGTQEEVVPNNIDQNEIIKYYGDPFGKLELFSTIRMREYVDNYIKDMSVENLSDYYHFQSSGDENNSSPKLEPSSKVLTRPNFPPFKNNKLSVSDRLPQFINTDMFYNQ